MFSVLTWKIKTDYQSVFNVLLVCHLHIVYSKAKIQYQVVGSIESLDYGQQYFFLINLARTLERLQDSKGDINQNTWTLICCEYDSITNEITIQDAIFIKKLKIIFRHCKYRFFSILQPFNNDSVTPSARWKMFRNKFSKTT